MLLRWKEDSLAYLAESLPHPDIGGGAKNSSRRGVQLKVAPVKADRSKKEKWEMPLFERFVTKGSQRTDELAKDGAMVDGGER